MSAAADLASLIEPVARELLGEPNARLSSKDDLRFGKRGSFSVKISAGVWFDNEAQKGGGVLDLIERETGLQGQECWDWLAERGYVEKRETRKPNGQAGEPRGKIVATYPYIDEVGEIVFEVVKLDPKDFRQRRPDENGGWIWSTKGVRQVIYRLPDIIDAIAQERTVVIVEGEGDVERLWAIGVPATCNAGGVGKWREELNETFANADVVVIPDNDPQKKHPKTGAPMFHDDGRPVLPGRDHAHAICAALDGVAARVRFLDLAVSWPDMPEKGDASDWIAAGGTAEALYALIEDAPEFEESLFKPKPPPIPWLDMSRWDFEPAPERKWAIRDRVPLNHAGLFSGEGGAGKSIIELMKNAAHVMGRDWLGSLPELGPAIYIGGEDDEDELHRRLAAIAEYYDVTFKELIAKGLYAWCLFGQDMTLCYANNNKSGRVETTELYDRIHEAAGDIKPKNISVDTLSRAFAGNEMDRVQVHAFSMHMQALALVAGGSVTILSHPSLQGINTGTGISGSTAWHGAFRFRQYLKGVKSENGEPIDSDLRELEFKKNQYGRLDDKIVLRYQNGLFLPERGKTTFEKAAAEANADYAFLALLRRFTSEGRKVSDKAKANNYAPLAFSLENEAKLAGLRKPDLVDAMRRLFAAKKIRVDEYGRKDPPMTRLVEV